MAKKKTARRRTPAAKKSGGDHVYKVIELVGSSTRSSDDAIKRAIDRARQTVRNMRWFEVVETRGHIEGDAIAHWQVKIKVGFTLD